MKLYLVDGTYELFRAYYSFPSTKNSRGREVGAARGYLRSLTTLLSGAQVTHAACAYDHVIESFRNELFPGYKTGEGIDPDLYSQFELAEEVSRALGIVTWPMVEFEADDALATAAHRFAREVEQVVIASPDKDLCQCVAGNEVVVWDRMRDIVLNEPGVIQKFGVPPASIPDYLALVGDSADGIPGVPRWGKKSAAEVLAHYQTVESIPLRASVWKPKVRGAESLAAELGLKQREVLLYKQLATLRRDVPLDERLSDLAYMGPNLPRLAQLADTLGEPDLEERVQSRLVKRSVARPA